MPVFFAQNRFVSHFLGGFVCIFLFSQIAQSKVKTLSQIRIDLIQTRFDAQIGDNQKIQTYESLFNTVKQRSFQFNTETSEGEILILQAQIRLHKIELQSNPFTRLFDLSTATKELEKALRIPSTSNQQKAVALVTLGEIEHNHPTGSNDLAKRYFEESIQLNPDGADAHFFLGKLLLEEGNVESAQKEFLSVLSLRPILDPNDPCDSDFLNQAQTQLSQLESASIY